MQAARLVRRLTRLALPRSPVPLQLLAAAQLRGRGLRQARGAGVHRLLLVAAGRARRPAQAPQRALLELVEQPARHR